MLFFSSQQDFVFLDDPQLRILACRTAYKTDLTRILFFAIVQTESSQQADIQCNCTEVKIFPMKYYRSALTEAISHVTLIVLQAPAVLFDAILWQNTPFPIAVCAKKV